MGAPAEFRPQVSATVEAAVTGTWDALPARRDRTRSSRRSRPDTLGPPVSSRLELRPEPPGTNLRKIPQLAAGVDHNALLSAHTSRSSLSPTGRDAGLASDGGGRPHHSAASSLTARSSNGLTRQCQTASMPITSNRPMRVARQHYHGRALAAAGCF